MKVWVDSHLPGLLPTALAAFRVTVAKYLTQGDTVYLRLQVKGTVCYGREVLVEELKAGIHS